MGDGVMVVHAVRRITSDTTVASKRMAAPLVIVDAGSARHGAAGLHERGRNEDRGGRGNSRLGSPAAATHAGDATTSPHGSVVLGRCRDALRQRSTDELLAQLRGSQTDLGRFVDLRLLTPHEVAGQMHADRAARTTSNLVLNVPGVDRQ